MPYCKKARHLKDMEKSTGLTLKVKQPKANLGRKGKILTAKNLTTLHNRKTNNNFSSKNDTLILTR